MKISPFAQVLLDIVPPDEELYKEYQPHDYIRFCTELEDRISKIESEIGCSYEKSQLFRRDIEFWPKKYKDFRKNFFDEMKPFRFLLESLAEVEPHQVVKYESNEKSYDAYIKSDISFRKIEFTTAMDKQLYALAMEGLAQEPIVHISTNATNLPRYEGTKRNRKFPDRFNVVATSDVEDSKKYCHLILEGIKRKHNDIWRGVSLGVVFDDLISSFDLEVDEDKCDFIKNVIAPLNSILSGDIKAHFEAIYLIGANGRYVYKLN